MMGMQQQTLLQPQILSTNYIQFLAMHVNSKTSGSKNYPGHSNTPNHHEQHRAPHQPWDFRLSFDKLAEKVITPKVLAKKECLLGNSPLSKQGAFPRNGMNADSRDDDDFRFDYPSSGNRFNHPNHRRGGDEGMRGFGRDMDYDDRREGRGPKKPLIESTQGLMRHLESEFNKFISSVDYKFNHQGKDESQDIMQKNKLKKKFSPLVELIKSKYQMQKRELGRVTNTSPLQNVVKLVTSIEGDIDEFVAKVKEVMDKFKAISDEKSLKYEQPLAIIKKNFNGLKYMYFDVARIKLMESVQVEAVPPFNACDYSNVSKKADKAGLGTTLATNGACSMYGTSFTEKTFSGLQNGNWLHNSVIDNYIEYLKYSRGYNDSNRSKSAIFSFGDSKRFEMASTFNFSTGAKVFTKFQRIGVVINEKEEHWFFIGVLMKENKMVIYDSIPRRRDTYTPFLRNYNEFIRKEFEASNLPPPTPLSIVDDETSPKQTNGSDCGIHVLFNLTMFLDNEGKGDKLTYDLARNRDLRAGMYHFMAYLLAFSREAKSLAKYDLLEYCSRSIILKDKGNILMKDI